jgi:hypothetical protein
MSGSISVLWNWQGIHRFVGGRGGALDLSSHISASIVSLLVMERVIFAGFL